MITQCRVCGISYTAKNPRSRYCSDRCRKRQQRSGAPVVSLPTTAPMVSSSLASVTEARLSAVGRFDTVLGQQAMVLARRIDSPTETGASVASMSRELRAVMELALENTVRASDPMDELKALRERRSAG